MCRRCLGVIRGHQGVSGGVGGVRGVLEGWQGGMRGIGVSYGCRGLLVGVRGCRV